MASVALPLPLPQGVVPLTFQRQQQGPPLPLLVPIRVRRGPRQKEGGEGGERDRRPLLRGGTAGKGEVVPGEGWRWWRRGSGGVTVGVEVGVACGPRERRKG